MRVVRAHTINMQSEKIEFRYNLSTDRIAIIISMAVFFFGSVIIWYVNYYSPNAIGVFFEALFLIPAILRGYGLVIALTKSPSSFYIDNGVLTAKMFSNKVITIPLNRIVELRKNNLYCYCSQYCISISSSDQYESFIVRDEQENNYRLIQAITQINPDCLIDPLILVSYKNYSSVQWAKHFRNLSFKLPLFCSIPFLLVTAYSFYSRLGLALQADKAGIKRALRINLLPLLEIEVFPFLKPESLKTMSSPA